MYQGKKVKELLNISEEKKNFEGGLEGEILRMVSNPWQRSYQMEYRIKPSKIYEDSLRLIESATYDYMLGNFISSYISMVPVVEKTLRDWAEELNLNTKNNRGYFSIFKLTKNLIRYLESKNQEDKNNNVFQKWISNQIRYFEFMVREVFYNSFDNSNAGVKKEFNRNRALHLLDGIHDNETLKNNNLRIFLLIDIIAELYLSLNTELYNKNTFNNDPEENIDFNLRWKIYLKVSIEGTKYTDMNILKNAFIDENKKTLCRMKQNYNLLS